MCGSLARHLNTIKMFYVMESRDEVVAVVNHYAEQFHQEISRLPEPYKSVVSLTPSEQVELAQELALGMK